MLIAEWSARADAGPTRDYAACLLAQFEIQSSAQGSLSPNDALAEPLSDRELEVLHIMAMGKTNREIARQLFIAPGTVKAHTASIYRKLDVTNRTEAVARARQIGILP
jgi:LuxR family maltose regulon positive regulatory protein